MASMTFPLCNTRSLQYLATRCNLLFLRSLRVVQDFWGETSMLFMGKSLLRGLKFAHVRHSHKFLNYAVNPETSQFGKTCPRVSCANGIIRSPSPNAIAVYATGFPIVPAWRTIAPIMKLTPAPMKRPNEVANANAVARTDVSYCSGSHRLNKVKFPPNNPRKNRHTMNAFKPFSR